MGYSEVCSYNSRFDVYDIIKIKKMSSFKSSENIQKKEGGPNRSVSDNQSK